MLIDDVRSVAVVLRQFLGIVGLRNGDRLTPEPLLSSPPNYYCAHRHYSK